MNDSMELQWGLDRLHDVFERMASDGDFGDQPTHFLNSILLSFKKEFEPFRTLATCFSEKGDLLSQWRAYAADGTGLAVGFNVGSLLNHTDYADGFKSKSAIQVLYDRAQQEVEIRALLKSLYIALGRPNPDPMSRFRSSPEYYERLGILMNSLLGYKKPAFAEESEIRLVEKIKVLFPGPIFESDSAHQRTVQFAFKNDGTPYMYKDVPFNREALKTVILGPKNLASSEQIDAFLRTLGFPNVQLSRSEASYR